MTCREAVDLLGSHLDGELPPDARLRLERHVALCDDCAEYVETYRRTVRLAKEASRKPDEAVPDDLVKAILSARRKA